MFVGVEKIRFEDLIRRFDSNSNLNTRFDSRFDSIANGRFTGPYLYLTLFYCSYYIYITCVCVQLFQYWIRMLGP